MSSTARLSNSAPPTATFSAARLALDEQPTLGGRAYCNALSAAADSWLSQLFAAAVEGRKVAAALIAVGGYGRGELCPGSDIDVVLLHKNERKISEVADALWYPIWDDGVHLDYSVRTPDEMVGMAGRDVKVALGLLTARCVAGDDDLAAGVIGQVQAQWASKARQSLSRLRAETEERWEQYGELAFLLEPDLKRARGGMRDVDAVHAAAAAQGETVAADPMLDAAVELLLRCRVALHQLTGRTSDHLVLDEQDRVAARVGAADADELMAAIAAAARRITWHSDDAWHRIDGPRASTDADDIGPGLAIVNNEIALTSAAAPTIDSSLALRAAAAAAAAGVPLAREAMAQLAAEGVAPPVPWPAATRDAFVALLGCGAGAVSLIETLDQLGVFERYLPEWVAVRSRPQRNAYHRFTVDRHLCETAANAARRVRDVGRPDILLVAALLHDIGKGSPGDHTVAGERIVADIATRMGFPPEDADELVRLVRYHLLLADVATRRDLDDPAAVAAVAQQVGTHESLDLLAALTEADSMATGPAAWGPWKAELLETLVTRAHAALAGEPPPPPTPLSEADRALMATGRLRLIADEGRVTVVAPDRPGLLSLVAGTFALHKLRIRGAVAGGEGDMACDVFELDTGWHDAPRWDRIEADLASALAGDFELEAKLARQAGGARPPRRASAARAAHARVLIDNTSTPAATIVEVRAPDAVGVLYRITGAIAVTGFDIASAKVLTLGHEIVDTFYVVEAGLGRRCTNPAALRRLEDAILSALRRPW